MDRLISKTLKQARNAMRREQRAKETCRSLLESLEQQNLINAELNTKLEAYEGTEAEFLSPFWLLFACIKSTQLKCHIFLFIYIFFDVDIPAAFQ